MNTDQASAASVPHPAPHRDKVSLWALMLGIAGGPTAWIVHHVANYALASYPCLPRGTPRVEVLPGWEWDRPTLWAVAILGILLSLITAGVAYRGWRATRDEGSGSSDLLDAGEGRTRFLAASGVAISLLSVAAIAFETLPLFTVPLCWR